MASRRGNLGPADPQWFLLLALAWILACGVGMWYAVRTWPNAKLRSVVWIALWMVFGVGLNLKCVQEIMYVS
ncbi:membrane protein [Rhodopirellula europaea 6C]|uniref:Membrane protein n=1 Tax=Rhodopirellula europaea 6C TaxID=1263867 RepID=M2AJ04_9BACT|nr:membrane protein [Rhodopirellula europaea 6C]